MKRSTVLKFGGAALRDGPAVRRACRIVGERGEERPVVVVSAHEGVTDDLVGLVEGTSRGAPGGDRLRVRHRSLLSQLGLDSELLDRHLSQLSGLLRHFAERPAGDPRAERQRRDHVLSFGERMSARVVAAALEHSGVAATPVDAYDLGLVAVAGTGGAPAVVPAEQRVREALDTVPGVPVVTGFLAADAEGHLTTLGRDGSDLTAALLGEAIGAQAVELWKTVDGLMTADPALVPEARPIARIGHEEARELAYHGARVLHPEAADAALRAGIPVLLRNAEDADSPGTRIEPGWSEPGPVGVAVRSDVVLLELEVDEDAERSSLSEAVTRGLGAADLEVLIQSADSRSLAVVAGGPGAGREELARSAPGAAALRPDVSLVTVVGRDVGRDARLGGDALASLARSGITPLLSGTSPRGAGLTWLVERAAAADAVRALHRAAFGG